jgi:hypothetical protein
VTGAICPLIFFKTGLADLPVEAAIEICPLNRDKQSAVKTYFFEMFTVELLYIRTVDASLPHREPFRAAFNCSRLAQLEPFCMKMEQAKFNKK